MIERMSPEACLDAREYWKQLIGSKAAVDGPCPYPKSMSASFHKLCMAMHLGRTLDKGGLPIVLKVMGAIVALQWLDEASDEDILELVSGENA